MTTLSVSGLPRKAKPTPVAKTTILFDATQRHPAPRDFGHGLLRSVPTARELNYRPTAYDRHVDALAEEATWTDSYCRGVLPL
jgi:hypothetical protein